MKRCLCCRLETRDCRLDTPIACRVSLDFYSTFCAIGVETRGGSEKVVLHRPHPFIIVGCGGQQEDSSTPSGPLAFLFLFFLKMHTYSW